MKRLMLLGDSIRLNYAPYVFRKLSDKVEVWGPEDNCRFAKYTLHEVGGWLKKCGTPDVIHWNNGLWDLHHFSDSGVLTPLPEYLQDLARIAEELQKTGATVIFATCTPVHPQNDEWNNREVECYNAAACRLMDRLGIPVNDLYAVVSGHEEEYINAEDRIHLNREGIRVVGQAVVDFVEPLF